MGEERRRYTRYIVKLPAILHSHEGLEAVAVNLSHGGVLLLGDFAFSDWEEVRLELRFPCGRALLVSSCVCWSDCGLAGLQFNGLSVEAQSFLDGFLEQLSRQDSGG